MLKKYGIRLPLVLLLGAFLLLGSVSVSVAADQVVLRTLSAWPKTTFEIQQFMKWVDMLQKAADEKYPGQLKIDYRGAGEVIGNKEQVEALRDGLIDMVATAPSYYTSIMPELDLLSLSNMTPWEQRESGAYDYLEELHNKKANAHFVSHFGTGSLFRLFMNKKITSSSELKGKKIRVSPTHIAFMKSLGAETIGMPPTDIYTAIERGVVDGYIQPPAVIRDFGLVPVSKYMIDPGFYEPCMTILINKSVWEKIPDNLKELINSTIKDGEHMIVENIQAKNEAEFEQFKKDGMEFVTLTDADVFAQKAREALEGVVLAKAPEEGKKLLGLITK